MTLAEWAARWGVPAEALRELADSLTHGAAAEGIHSEAGVQSAVRLAAAQRGMRLFRNNVGAAKTDTGSFVRFGIANDSAALNRRLKSADLIGWETVDGVARFLSVECKAPGWRYSPNDAHEQAQLAWAMLVNNAGGRAIFATGPDAL